MIEFLEIKENLEYKDFAKNLYNEAFPPEERWNFEATIENENKDNYNFYIIKDGDIPIGFIMIWDFYNSSKYAESKDFVFIEYLAIDKKLRGKNYGSKVLNKIFDSLKDKLIVIEVEPYDLNETAKKRIGWYLRYGFILSDYDYDMPYFKNGKKLKLNLKIMSTKKFKSKEEHDKITAYLYERIYKPRLEEIEKWRG